MVILKLTITIPTIANARAMSSPMMHHPAAGLASASVAGSVKPVVEAHNDHVELGRYPGAVRIACVEVANHEPALVHEQHRGSTVAVRRRAIDANGELCRADARPSGRGPLPSARARLTAGRTRWTGIVWIAGFRAASFAASWMRGSSVRPSITNGPPARRFRIESGRRTTKAATRRSRRSRSNDMADPLEESLVRDYKCRESARLADQIVSTRPRSCSIRQIDRRCRAIATYPSSKRAQPPRSR